MNENNNQGVINDAQPCLNNTESIKAFDTSASAKCSQLQAEALQASTDHEASSLGRSRGLETQLTESVKARSSTWRLWKAAPPPLQSKLSTCPSAAMLIPDGAHSVHRLKCTQQLQLLPQQELTQQTASLRGDHLVWKS